MTAKSVVKILVIFILFCSVFACGGTTQQTRNASQVEPIQDTILCKDTGGKSGSTVSCKIPRAYCSYEPGIEGSPTFCNDAPYPNHGFTLVVWEQNWSQYDGKCIIVTGQINLYKGKPQIEAASKSQVSYCP